MTVTTHFPQVVIREADDELPFFSNIEMSKYNPDKGEIVMVNMYLFLLFFFVAALVTFSDRASPTPPHTSHPSTPYTPSPHPSPPHTPSPHPCTTKLPVNTESDDEFLYNCRDKTTPSPEIRLESPSPFHSRVSVTRCECVCTSVNVMCLHRCGQYQFVCVCVC